jgi:hypothetical protein
MSNSRKSLINLMEECFPLEEVAAARVKSRKESLDRLGDLIGIKRSREVSDLCDLFPGNWKREYPTLPLVRAKGGASTVLVEHLDQFLRISLIFN